MSSQRVVQPTGKGVSLFSDVMFSVILKASSTPGLQIRRDAQELPPTWAVLLGAPRGLPEDWAFSDVLAWP